MPPQKNTRAGQRYGFRLVIYLIKVNLHYTSFNTCSQVTTWTSIQRKGEVTGRRGKNQVVGRETKTQSVKTHRENLCRITITVVNISQYECKFLPVTWCCRLGGRWDGFPWQTVCLGTCRHIICSTFASKIHMRSGCLHRSCRTGCTVRWLYKYNVC